MVVSLKEFYKRCVTRVYEVELIGHGKLHNKYYCVRVRCNGFDRFFVFDNKNAGFTLSSNVIKHSDLKNEDAYIPIRGLCRYRSNKSYMVTDKKFKEFFEAYEKLYAYYGFEVDKN